MLSGSDLCASACEVLGSSPRVEEQCLRERCGRLASTSRTCWRRAGWLGPRRDLNVKQYLEELGLQVSDGKWVGSHVTTQANMKRMKFNDAIAEDASV